MTDLAVVIHSFATFSLNYCNALCMGMPLNITETSTGAECGGLSTGRMCSLTACEFHITGFALESDMFQCTI